MMRLAFDARVLPAHIVQSLDENVLGDCGACPLVDIVANFLRQYRQICLLDMLKVDLLLGIKSS